MAGMPRLLALARRPLAASLYRVVYPVADRLPASATSAPVRDLAPRCSIPPSHGWEARVAVRAFSSSSGEGGGNGSSGPRESGAAQGGREEPRPRPRPRTVKGQGDPKTKRRSRANKSSPTSPPASGIHEERRGAYLTVEDPGLRDLGLGGVGVGASAAGGIGKDLVAAVDTDCDVNAGAASGIGMVSVNKDASDGSMNAEAASAIGKASVDTDASGGSMNTGGSASAMGEGSVPPDGGVHTGAGNNIAKVSVAGGVVTDAAGVVCKDAAFGTGTNAAAGMTSEAGHGVGGTEASPRPSRKRRMRTTKAAAAVPEKLEGDVAKRSADPVIVKRRVRKAGVEQNAAPGNGSGGKDQQLVADVKNDTTPGKAASTQSENGAAVEQKPAPRKAASTQSENGAGVEQKPAPRKATSGHMAGVEKDTEPGSRRGASSSHPGRKSGSNAAGVGSSQARQKEGEKKLRISIARCLRALENKIEEGLLETRAHLERKLTWMQSTFESTLQKHLRKYMKKQQAASGKLQLKHTAFVFLGVLIQILGLVAVCLYAGYMYGWTYIEHKVYELAYDDRAKALAVQAFESGIKYAVAKITFQHARDEFKKKLPEWLGGRKEEEKKEAEKKEEEKVTRFMWCWVRRCNRWRNKAEGKKKKEEMKRKEEEERRKEEEEKRKAEENKEEGENEEKWYSMLWCLWPGSWWWLWPGNWCSKKDEGDKVEEDGEKVQEDGEKKENDESP